MNNLYIFGSTFVATCTLIPHPLLCRMVVEEPSLSVRKTLVLTYGVTVVCFYAVTGSWIISLVLAFALLELLFRTALALTCL